MSDICNPTCSFCQQNYVDKKLTARLLGDYEFDQSRTSASRTKFFVAKILLISCLKNLEEVTLLVGEHQIV